MSEIILPITGGLNTTTPPQLLYTTARRPYLAFDGTTDEFVQYTLRFPSDYSSALTVKALYSMDDATANNVALRTQVMAVTAAENIETDSFDTLDKSTDSVVPATANLMKEISMALTNVDSLAADDYFAIQIGRENATTGTNASNDMYIWALSLSYATS